MSEIKETSTKIQENQPPSEQKSHEAQNQLDDIADSGKNYETERANKSQENIENRKFTDSHDKAHTEKDAAQEQLDDIADDFHTDSEFGKVEPVNGRMPQNHEFAGKKYPVENLSPELQKKYPESVNFNEKAFAEFSPYSKAEVQIELTGDRRRDFKEANNACGFKKTPEGYTWHHHEDAKTLQLVPTDIHDGVKHTGGCATSGLEYNKRK